MEDVEGKRKVRAMARRRLTRELDREPTTEEVEAEVARLHPWAVEPPPAE